MRRCVLLLMWMGCAKNTTPVDAPTTAPVSSEEICADTSMFGPVNVRTEHLSQLHRLPLSLPDYDGETAYEFCGLNDSLRLLLALRCADGSAAFTDADTAHGSRSGSVGSERSRCGKIVDRYVVPCAEQSYTVFVDMYMCGPEETFR